ncbi:MAG: helix-turn-helix domain-containing protein [Candidatus Binatia bacterium]
MKEAANLSRLGQSTIHLLIRKRQLKAHQVGSRVIIKRSDLERLLEAHPIEALSD